MARVTEAHLEARRRDILDAAALMFAGKGTANTTMADIATQAGISAGAIYRYFSSKDDLVAACFHEGAQQFADEWKLQFTATADPRGTFLDISARTFEELNDSEANARTRIMLEHYLDATRGQSRALDECCTERETVVQGLSLGLELMKKAGQLPNSTNIPSLAAALWSFWIGSRVTRLLVPEADTDGQLRALAGILTAAGGAEPGVAGHTTTSS